SFGRRTVNSYLSSAISFFSRARTGSSMNGLLGARRLGQHAAGDLARLPPVEPSREPLTQRRHDRSERPRLGASHELPNRALELGGIERGRHVRLEHLAFAPTLRDELAAAGLGRALL